MSSELLESVTLHRDSFAPLHIQLREAFENEIQAGVFQVGSFLPSENRVASRFNISRISVRKAYIELSRRGIATPRKGQGWVVIGLPRESLRDVGILTVGHNGLIDLPLYRNVISSAGKIAQANGLLLTPFLVTEGASRQVSEALEHRNLRAIVILGAIEDPEMRATVEGLSCTKISVGFRRKNPNAHHYVMVDQCECGRLAAQRLLETGHKRFALLTSKSDENPWPDRQEGFLEEVEKAGFPRGNVMIERLQDHVPSSMIDQLEHSRTARRLAAHGGGVGIFCLTDWLAFALYRQFNEIGIRVPHDVSLVGCDGVPEEQIGVTVQLDGLIMPVEKIGQEVIQLALREQIDDLPEPSKITLRPWFRSGETVMNHRLVASMQAEEAG